MNAYMKKLGVVERHVQELTRLTPEDGPDTADAIGRVRFVETTLADHRRMMVSELPAQSIGSSYKVTPKYVTDRSYALSAIIGTVTSITGGDAFRALFFLVRSDAVRVTPQWSALRKFFAEHDLELRVVGHEIEDTGAMDGPHVGEVVRSEGATITGVKG